MLSNFQKQLIQNKELYLRIKVRPCAAKSAVREIMQDEEETIKIDIAAQPIKGKANQELIKFLAMEFEINKNNVKIISGAGEKVKLVKIEL